MTDACVAMMCARTAILGALLNVPSISFYQRREICKEMTEEADMIKKRQRLPKNKDTGLCENRFLKRRL